MCRSSASPCACCWSPSYPCIHVVCLLHVKALPRVHILVCRPASILRCPLAFSRPRVWLPPMQTRWSMLHSTLSPVHCLCISARICCFLHVNSLSRSSSPTDPLIAICQSVCRYPIGFSRRLPAICVLSPLLTAAVHALSVVACFGLCFPSVRFSCEDLAVRLYM